MLLECRKCIHQLIIVLPAASQCFRCSQVEDDCTKHELSFLATSSKLVMYLCATSAVGHRVYLGRTLPGRNHRNTIPNLQHIGI
jgi:hypothetical protein